METHFMSYLFLSLSLSHLTCTWFPDGKLIGKLHHIGKQLHLFLKHHSKKQDIVLTHICLSCPLL